MDNDRIMEGESMIIYEVIAWEPYEKDTSWGHYRYLEDAQKRKERLEAQDDWYCTYGGGFYIAPIEVIDRRINEKET